ncbi:MAG TPA: hypothetical protein VGO67_24335 [Verrucomicrobiae bacterium]|jgi:hypothetical protein
MNPFESYRGNAAPHKSKSISPQENRKSRRLNLKQRKYCHVETREAFRLRHRMLCRSYLFHLRLAAAFSARLLARMESAPGK